MANVKKKENENEATSTKTTSTASKTTSTKSSKSKAKESNQDDIIKQLMAQIEAQNKMMQELQAKVDAQPQAQIQSNSFIRAEENFGGKKIKVINLLNCGLNLSTEPDGQGRAYTFAKYGDSRMIKFDDLNDIVSTYPNATENGYFYITNPDVVEYFDLTEEYKHIYTKEMIDSIIKLENDTDVDLFIGMNEELQNSTKIAIANRINANERMDYNNLRRIKEECGIDIEKIANELKENFSTKPQE
ncbi:MAG: hypothetical protein KBT03_00680 [Bacteroidales bacterium]|nr:hypothetical protein [Candidatus Scybalousia scybalohippi]